VRFIMSRHTPSLSPVSRPRMHWSLWYFFKYCFFPSGPMIEMPPLAPTSTTFVLGIKRPFKVGTFWVREPRFFDTASVVLAEAARISANPTRLPAPAPAPAPAFGKNSKGTRLLGPMSDAAPAPVPAPVPVPAPAPAPVKDTRSMTRTVLTVRNTDLRCRPLSILKQKYARHGRDSLCTSPPLPPFTADLTRHGSHIVTTSSWQVIWDLQTRPKEGNLEASSRASASQRGSKDKPQACMTCMPNAGELPEDPVP
jgi:hypothetical protein